MELTREHFDQQLSKLVTKADFDQHVEKLASKEDLVAAIDFLGSVINETIAEPLTQHLVRERPPKKLPMTEFEKAMRRHPTFGKSYRTYRKKHPVAPKKFKL